MAVKKKFSIPKPLNNLYFKRYPRMSCVVSPLPPEIATIDAEEEGACFAEVLQVRSSKDK